MWTHERETLRRKASGTKRGSIGRQRLIEETAEEVLDNVANCTLNSNPDYRIFVDTWVKPQLQEIIRAAAGKHHV